MNRKEPDFGAAVMAMLMPHVESIGARLADLTTDSRDDSASLLINETIFQVIYEYYESYISVRVAPQFASKWLGHPKKLYLEEQWTENLDTLLERSKLPFDATEIHSPALRTQSGLEEGLAVIGAGIMKYIRYQRESNQTGGRDR